MGAGAHVVLAQSMKLALLAIVLTLQGCAAYTVASLGSYAVSGKGIGDHAAGAVTGGDCNVVKHAWTGEYTCEMPVVYNRSGL